MNIAEINSGSQFETQLTRMSHAGRLFLLQPNGLGAYALLPAPTSDGLGKRIADEMLLRGRPCRDALAQNGFNFRGYILLARVYEGTLSPVTPFVLVETLSGSLVTISRVTSV